MDKRSLIFIVCVSLAFFAIQAWYGSNEKKESATKIEKQETIVQTKSMQNVPDTPRPPSFDDTLYVLENEYQQLVFSTRGGTLCEINLPLKSKTSPNSLVNEIEADRQILDDDPANARFPSRPAYFAGKRGLTDGAQGGYYPLLRRTVYRPDGSIAHAIDAQYQSLAIVGTDQNLADLEYRVSRFEKNLIQFEASYQGRRITKTISIPEEKAGPYCFDITVQIDGDASGLWLSSGVPDVELVSGSFSPLIRTQVSQGKSNDVETISLSKKHPIVESDTVSPRWISNSNGFFGIILDPLTQIAPGFRAKIIPGPSVVTRLSTIDATYQPYPPEKYPGYATYLPLKSNSQMLFRVFAGPFDESLLKKLDALYEDPLTSYFPEYTNAQSIQGWFSFISQPFSKFLYLLLQMFYFLTRSWGFSIILLTIALRAMMYPLNNWSIKSTVRMQEIAPKIKAIQDRNKSDAKRAQLEIMTLYKQQGINPFSGCFPMLLQMPFLIGMFYLLKATFPLRGAVFIPGWIDNLAAPDTLFGWGYPIFLIGNEFHLLPILLGATMFIQQRMTQKTPKDVKDLSDSQKQQKMMGNMMSIVFTVMFYSFPSGLNIYFISSTLLGILQQYYVTKKMKGQPIVLKK